MEDIHLQRGPCRFGVLQAADWVDLLGSERAGIAVTVISIVGAVLRFVIEKPATKSRN